MSDTYRDKIREALGDLSYRGVQMTPAEAETYTRAVLAVQDPALTELANMISELDDDNALATGLLHSIWLYVDWRYVTRQLTTEQREAWADAVERASAWADPGNGTKADRWWLPEAVSDRG